ncbi:MAG: serine hydrolase, partial [Odoribacter sp.]
MKYFILILVIALIATLRPWEMSLARGIFKFRQDSTLIASAKSKDAVKLLPANHVITNIDSELEMTQKFDKIINDFMRKWDI